LHGFKVLSQSIARYSCIESSRMSLSVDNYTA